MKIKNFNKKFIFAFLLLLLIFLSGCVEKNQLLSNNLIDFKLETKNENYYQGEVNFYSDNTSIKPLLFKVKGNLTLNKSLVCSESGEELYKHISITLTNKQNPVLNKTYYWDNIDYCPYSSYSLFLEKEQIQEAENPKFLMWFQYENSSSLIKKGEAYCNNEKIGDIKNGELKTSKQFLLNNSKPTCIVTMNINYNNTILWDCSWNVTKKEIIKYDIYNFSIGKPEQLLRNPACFTQTYFVTPEDKKVKEKLKQYLPNPSNSIYTDLKKINEKFENQFKFESDEKVFNQTDWYKFPNETLETLSGDCEDWANAFLSLALAREPTPCYAVMVEYTGKNNSIIKNTSTSHVLTLCVINNKPVIFDQGNTYATGDIWKQDFNDLDVTEKDKQKGAYTLIPTEYWNNSYYSEVNGTQQLYSQIKVNQTN